MMDVCQIRALLYDKYNSLFLGEEGMWTGYLSSMGINRSDFHGPPYVISKINHDSVEIECPWSVQNLPEHQILLRIPMDLANRMLILGYLP